ncbi:MAG TPA: cbb3-type cytochrome oxidase assembly protein CcoS [Campylobacterales bacterium]|nr:cbb3-type cytochrome oxidase assembly protein CcoS [Campylobacterales bacterium]HIO71258.1 cbb3-type cytochrome oxidase assembly protein CcoS [Campylobacterales bacterium]
MSDSVIVLMLSVSTLLGAFGLIAFIWGLKTGQFDDQEKMMNSVLFDNEEDLQRKAKMEEKKKNKKK